MKNIIKTFTQTITDRKFWGFFGTGLIVSVAYTDPGNWGAAITSGASFNYALLWVIWLASAMGILFQYLSGKLGIAGYSIGELIKNKWKQKWMVTAYWLLSELVIIATDPAEFLGIALALNLLFGIPLMEAIVLASLDILVLMFLMDKKFRMVEYFFIVAVSILSIGYIYEIFISSPNIGGIVAGSVTPILTPEMIVFAVGIIGATVMPHALFVHSWLDRNKMKENENELDKKTALRYHTLDNAISLTISGFINAAILIMAAAAFYGVSGGVASIEEAYKTLAPLFGQMASYVFAIALLAAGISSSITATLAGQSVMESMTNFKLSNPIRRLITRAVNIVPLFILVAMKIEPLQILLYSQVLLSLLIPLPLIPLIYYTADTRVMGELVNKKITTIIAAAFTVVILVFNCYLIYHLFV